MYFGNQLSLPSKAYTWQKNGKIEHNIVTEINLLNLACTGASKVKLPTQVMNHKASSVVCKCTFLESQHKVLSLLYRYTCTSSCITVINIHLFYVILNSSYLQNRLYCSTGLERLSFLLGRNAVLSLVEHQEQ